MRVAFQAACDVCFVLYTDVSVDLFHSIRPWGTASPPRVSPVTACPPPPPLPAGAGGDDGGASVRDGGWGIVPALWSRLTRIILFNKLAKAWTLASSK